ncbi:hypothetical protein M8C21_003238, partial [Ambrosia artemisiifolia]
CAIAKVNFEKNKISQRFEAFCSIQEMIGSNDKIVDLDVDFMDLQLCETMTCHIYQHPQTSECRRGQPNPR